MAQRWQPRTNPPRRCSSSRSADRVDAAESFIEDERQRIEVALAADRAPVGLLGGHVGERANDIAGVRQCIIAGNQCDPEVGQFDNPSLAIGAVGNDHVGRFDVTVDNSARMGMIERVAESDADPRDVAVGQFAGYEPLAQSLAADQFGD